MIKTIVVDDEKLARIRLISLIKQTDELDLIAEFSSGKKAVSEINALKPDLVFLDINMPDINGFGVLQKIDLKQKPIIVFVTAHDEFALKAFDHSAFDYLLKPFKDNRFYQTIDRIKKLSKSERESVFEKKYALLQEFYSKESSISENSIAVKLGNVTKLIKKAEIQYIVADGYYVEVFTNGKKFLLRESLSNLINRLSEMVFCRIHRSYIVNINEIEEIVHSQFSEIDVRMKNGKLLRVSKSKKNQLYKALGIS